MQEELLPLPYKGGTLFKKHCISSRWVYTSKHVTTMCEKKALIVTFQ